MGTEPKRILIIEDDPRIVELLLLHLGEDGYLPEACARGSEGLALLEEKNYVLLILDIMLPDISGIEICKTLRAKGNRIPLLMLTARGDELDKVLGLELGADDYMTKPFGIRELLARIKALIRRSEELAPAAGGPHPERVMHRGELVLDTERRTVSVRDTPVELTAREFDLLRLFAQSPGKAYSREELLRTIWGYNFDGYQHTVNSHINRLRAKIEEDQGNPRFIQTVWGFGYKFSPSFGDDEK